MEQNHMLARPPPVPPAQTKETLACDEASTVGSLVALAALAPLPARMPQANLLTQEPQPQFELQPSATDPFVFNQAPSHARHTSPLPLHSKALQQPLSQPPYPSSYSHLAQPPPAYGQSHDPASLAFPEPPKAELAPIQFSGEARPGAQRTTFLPSLSSVTGAQSPRYPAPLQPSEPSPPTVKHWPSLNPLTAYYSPSHAQSIESPQNMDADGGNPGSSIGAFSAASPDRYYDGRAGSVSLDDPDVRLAAEALGDLRADFVSSPPNHNTPLPTSSPSDSSLRQPPEPLISLLTTSHPLLATTIEGATSAYNNSKNFSPRFKSSAEYVEGYLTPIANTVGSVGRVTGVEGSVRWFLGGGRRHQSSDLEAADGASNKRRKVEGSSETAPNSAADRSSAPDLEIYGFTKDRRTSMSTVDTLPAYDDHRSPAYSESIDGGQTQVASRPASRGSAAWQQRLILSTSGLSIAMSAESLRSLKYCLQWLKWANEHIGKVIATLKVTLDQYERPGDRVEVEPGMDHAMSDSGMGGEHESRSELVARINTLKIDVLKTLRDVIETVSKYAGGALPENARELVKRHLTSLPQRFRLATMQDPSAQAQGQNPEAEEKAVKEGAQKVLVLAKEGLGMMAQVSGVLDGTIVSAEEWCERLGKKRREERDALRTNGTTESAEPLTSVVVDGDVKMS